MKTEKYLPSKTAGKAAIPASILILINIAIAVIKQNGIDIDESSVWQIALAGYGAIIALINWIKHHKKGKAASG